jgi:hypothetical protein
MPQVKNLSVVKWNPYNVGEISTLIKKEINKLVANKEYRKKLGLEKGVYNEFRGNTHWNMFISIQLAEVLTKRINEDMRNMFIQHAHGLNNTSNHINNLSQQLQKAEFAINNASTLAGNNVIKTIKADLNKLSKIANMLKSINDEQKKGMDTIKSDIEENLNQIQNKVDEGIENLLSEYVQQTESSKNEIIDDIKEFRKFSDGKTKELMDQFSNKMVSMEKQLTDLNDRVNNFQETNSNAVEDQKAMILTEFQEGIGGVLKQNLENVEAIRKNNEDFKDQTITQINDSNDNLNSELEATNQHIEQVNQNITESIRQTELQFGKELKTEITDVRNILSNIRSDIELMKSVLTKLDGKIH